MTDEELRQTINEVREMKQMCGNINMKLTNIVTQRGQDWKKKLEAEYQRGLDDAWEAAKKIFGYEIDGGIPIDEIGSVFGYSENATFCTADIFRHNTVSEAIEKLKAYEEKQKAENEIKVGDEVEISQSDANGIWVVIKVEKHDGYEAYCAINKDGDIYFEEEQDRVTKTGRRFDIESILEDMRE